MTVEPVLRVRGLVKAYPIIRWRRGRPERRLVRALNGVDLDLLPGECLGVVGESGCGKTTLARCLARHETVDAGSVWLHGVDLLAAKGAALRRQRRRVQLVFQNSTAALDPRRSVGASVAEGLAATEPARRTKRVAELLDAVGLMPGLADRYPHQLSGGQRQRIAIARALAAEPAVLLLDEPVSALDATVRRRVLRQLALLRRRFGVAVVFIGHDLGVVGAVAERLAVLYAGRVVETGPTRQVLDDPRHPYTAALVESVPEAVPGARLVAPMADEAPSPVTPPSGCAFHPRCPRAEAICRRQLPELRPIDEGGGSIGVACHRPLVPRVDGVGAEPATPRRRHP